MAITAQQSLDMARKFVTSSHHALASRAPATAQFKENADDALLANGWSIIDNPHRVLAHDPARVLVIAQLENEQKVVSPFMFSNEDHFEFVMRGLAS